MWNFILSNSCFLSFELYLFIYFIIMIRNVKVIGRVAIYQNWIALRFGSSKYCMDWNRTWLYYNFYLILKWSSSSMDLLNFGWIIILIWFWSGVVAVWIYLILFYFGIERGALEKSKRSDWFSSWRFRLVGFLIKVGAI